MSPRFVDEQRQERTFFIEKRNFASSSDNAFVETHSVIDNLAGTALQAPDTDLFAAEKGSETKMPLDIISACYAATVATGGIIGYAKAGSIPSLVAGLVFGGILGVGTYMTSVNPDNYHLTFGTSVALGGLMGYRFYNSGKFMPAGLVALLSAGMVLRFSMQYFKLTNKHK